MYAIYTGLRRAAGTLVAARWGACSGRRRVAADTGAVAGALCASGRVATLAVVFRLLPHLRRVVRAERPGSDAFRQAARHMLTHYGWCSDVELSAAEVEAVDAMARLGWVEEQARLHGVRSWRIRSWAHVRGAAQ